MLWTTLAFILVTAVIAWYHVRASRAEKVDTGSCPRCGTQVSASTPRCPGCGVPRQAFEVVGLDEAEEQTEEGDSEVRPHAVVRADLCVGCAACVPACPEEGAIRMQGKLAIVERALCVGHGCCAEACPVGGILLTTGAAVHRVEVPDVGVDFQCNVPGIYIAGELGGRGLIKNAVNEGRIAAENVAQDLREAGASPNPAVYDVAIVGSGPAGLSAGLEAHRRGLRYLVLEQGSLADTIRKYPRKKLLLAEPLKVPLYGELWVADASKENLIQVWETIIESTGLRVRTEHRVESIEDLGGEFALNTTRGPFIARRVILAMGRRGTPRKLGVAGEELETVLYDIVEMEAFQGQRVIVVGGGDSAVESALGLANQPGTEVLMSYRGDAFKRVKERNRDKLQAALDARKVKLCLRSQLMRIGRGEVDIRVDGVDQTLPNDYVIVRIGGEPPEAFLGRIGIRMIKKDVPLPDAPAESSVV